MSKYFNGANIISIGLTRHLMHGYLPKKEIVFFNPGKEGVIFTHAANHYITAKQLLHAQEYFVKKTGNPVIYIEDRRHKSRGNGEGEKLNDRQKTSF